MMIPRFFCDIPLQAGQGVTLPDEVAHHAERVLRLRPGDDVVLFNGRGGEYVGQIGSLGKVARVMLFAHDSVERESPIHVTLAQGLAAADRMDWAIQKATELGVARIVPVACARSVVRLAGPREQRRLVHWRSVAVSACEQCGRNRLPDLTDVQPRRDWLAVAAHTMEPRLMLAPGAPMALRDIERPARLTLLVGPEGGLTAEEAKAAESAGFRPVRLGPRVMRTETAGVAALAAMLALWGDF